MADMKAPANAEPVMDRSPAPERVAVAAPSDAPALTPIMWGSAKGFLNTLCICEPAMARAAPARMAVAARGARRSHSTCGLGAAFPAIMSAAANIRSRAVQTQTVMVCLFAFMAANIAKTFSYR